MIALVLSMVLTVSPVKVEKTLQQYLSATYGWAQVHVSNIKSEGTLPGGTPKKIEILRGPLGRAKFLMVYSSGRTVLVRATVVAKDYVLVSTVPIRKGQSPEQIGLARRLMDVRRMPSDVITDETSLQGLRARYNIRAGTLLRLSMFEREPVLRKGQKVTILYQKGALRVTAPGLLRQDALKGRPVEVLNLATKKVLKGIAKEGGIVDVTP